MMMKKKNLQILLICGVLLVTACKSKSKEEQQSGYRMEGDTVQITDRFLSIKFLFDSHSFNYLHFQSF